MDSEQLVRQIMAEVMKNLEANPDLNLKPNISTGTNQVNTGQPNTISKIGKQHYPLAEKHPELIQTNTGLTLDDLTLVKVKSGDLKPEDFRISAATLELQAQVAEADGRVTLARNMRRAAELVAVPDEKLLAIYNSLRPYRSTKAELLEIARDLEESYNATISAGFIREAANVYEARGRLRED
ncbi:MAG: propanediol dehydratase [Propionibacterium sp.]|nr:MAG: propanediol dehydratase [Propionibacterium sp.]